MTRINRTAAAALAASLLTALALNTSQAQTNAGTAFTYQGRLTQGSAPVNGTCTFNFGLWDAASLGAQVGLTQTHSVSVNAGYFTVPNLEFGNFAFDGRARWLQIAVNCGSGFIALNPRQPVTSAPYANSLRPGALTVGAPPSEYIYYAENTSTSGLNASGFWGVSRSANGGRGVTGFAAASAGTTYGVWGQSDSPDGIGVYGWHTAATGSAPGVRGETQSTTTNASGVSGLASATSGTTYGVYGQSNSTSGVGVFGAAFATSGTTYGVYGRSSSTDGVGVYGLINSSDGIGVMGDAPSVTGQTYGVYGRSSSTEGYGVYGLASFNSGTTYGVYGRTASPDGYGVYGWHQSSSGTTPGVYGGTNSVANNAVGVLGQVVPTSPGGFSAGVYGVNRGTGVNGIGVWGNHAGSGYGVYGTVADTVNGYAGYFFGRVNVTGNLSKGGGSFKIDHPLDPANKYLYHSFVESPDMKNIYDGVVALDANGEAWVTLPDWFEALNMDFRYQLTPIGASMPGLFIAEEISGNRFKIAGGVPNKKVSWQVTGTRNDPYAQMYRIPVEENKPAAERGTYLHPEAHGQPKTLGLDYQRNAALRGESERAGGGR